MLCTVVIQSGYPTGGLLMCNEAFRQIDKSSSRAGLRAAVEIFEMGFGAF
jgi:hypothetical protein